MNMEKPIRGLRGTGGMGTGAGDATRINQSYDNTLKELKEKYDYDMSKIVNDDTVNDPRIEEDDKKKDGMSMQANNSEDGVNGKLRVGKDPTAEAMTDNNSSANSGTINTKAEIYSVGGTRGGSYENTSNDSQQWDRQVSGGKNGRETKRIDSGEKDSLNTVNRAVDKLKDTLNAIEIKRVTNKIYIP